MSERNSTNSPLPIVRIVLVGRGHGSPPHEVDRHGRQAGQSCAEDERPARAHFLSKSPPTIRKSQLQGSSQRPWVLSDLEAGHDKMAQQDLARSNPRRKETLTCWSGLLNRLFEEGRFSPPQPKGRV